MNLENNQQLKDTNFWKKEIENQGIKLRFFNDVIVEKRAPDPDSNYGVPVVTDVVLDGKKCNIYHSDKNPHDTWHRVFIHVKE